MSLAHGRPYLAIPGPSVIPDAVLQAMHRASPNIYEGDLIDMVGGMIPELRAVARTDGNVAIYIANGHGAWEAALANTVAPGEKVLVCATGRFGHGWAEMAEGLGIEVEILDFGLKTPIDAARVREALRADQGGRVKAVLAVHVDTSTSLRSDVAEIRRALGEAGHPALLMVDCIASLGCDPFEMDLWGADVTVTGSQKGLMVPPGNPGDDRGIAVWDLTNPGSAPTFTPSNDRMKFVGATALRGGKIQVRASQAWTGIAWCLESSSNTGSTS